MRLLPCLTALLIATAVWATAQANADQQKLVSTECGFRAKLPTGWQAEPSSKKCGFTIHVPDSGVGTIELSVRKDSIEHGQEDLGFKQENGRWILRGDETVDAEADKSATWNALTGTFTTRNTKNKSSSEPSTETRVLLVSHNGRIAEIIGTVDEQKVGDFEFGFEFLPEPASESR